MKPTFIEDLGMHFPTKTSKRKHRYHLFQCPTCDNNFKSFPSDVKNGKIVQCRICRIKKRTKHGLSKTPLYQVWADMKDRCYNINNKRYKDYGDRGISVCDEWKNFKNFALFAFSSGYNQELTIDRKDNDGNYTENNCRWVDLTTQNQNNRLIRSSNTSGYRGVSKDKRSGKYRSRIQVNGKEINLGLFKTKIEASNKRDLYIIDNKLNHPLNSHSCCVISDGNL